MPQPTYSDVHVNAALTDISVAYVQDDANFIADKVFPPVPVVHQSDQYFIFSKDDFFRDEAQLRADAVESAGGGFNLTQGTYSAKVWGFHKDIGDQVRRNADPAIDIDVSTTKFVTQKMMIRRDRFFVATYLTTGIWGTDITGVASNPGANQTIQWSDDVNGDPFTDIENGQTTILQNTGHEPNVLLLAFQVFQALRKHPLVIDRIKYTVTATAAKITPALMAQAFDVEEVVVSKAVYNTSQEGVTAVNAFVTGKVALLCYKNPSPGLFEPSAGYTFPWQGFTGLNSMGIKVYQVPMPWLGLNTVRTEAEMSFDMQVVAPSLGYFFNSIVA